MPQMITTTIEPNGDVSFDLHGFVGNECEETANRMRQELEMLGIKMKVTDFTRKAPSTGNAASTNRAIKT